MCITAHGVKTNYQRQPLIMPRRVPVKGDANEESAQKHHTIPENSTDILSASKCTTYTYILPNMHAHVQVTLYMYIHAHIFKETLEVEDNNRELVTTSWLHCTPLVTLSGPYIMAVTASVTLRVASGQGTLRGSH